MPGHALTKPLMVFDGDCSFCRRWITRWQHLTAGAIDYEPYQSAADKFPEVPREAFGKSVYLFEPGQHFTHAAQAVFRSLALANQFRFLYFAYQHIPAFALLAEFIYAFIAAHRDGLDIIDRIIVGVETRPITYRLTRSIFLRALGLIYLFAFISLFTQIDGLIGSKGLLPAHNFTTAGIFDHTSFWQLPTLVRFSSSDAFLHALCISGIAAASLLIIGLAPLLMTPILWLCYLSLTVVGQDFLGFQWDALLLEAGFLAILWSPPFWANTSIRPSRLVLFLLRWLLFRLMFLSALVKWFSGDDAWRTFHALRYHFETQPLPVWTSVSAAHAPDWMLTFACAAMFFIEGIVPFLFFAPRRTRMFACWLTILFQLTILATGNYGFFNFLAIALCIPLLDDAALARLFHLRIRALSSRKPILRKILIAPIAVILLIVTTMQGVDEVNFNPDRWPRCLDSLRDHIAPFESTNAYGLFAVMTRTRPEIIVEGSNDGITWTPYAFKYKPGDVHLAPAFCEPHMPRLDWQMWFAALEGQPPSWFDNFMLRLLQGEPTVLNLLKENPFPAHPPRYIRATLYDYQFTFPAERAQDHQWWTRRRLGIYFPPMSLDELKADQN